MKTEKTISVNYKNYFFHVREETTNEIIEPSILIFKTKSNERKSKSKISRKNLKEIYESFSTDINRPSIQEQFILKWVEMQPFNETIFIKQESINALFKASNSNQFYVLSKYLRYEGNGEDLLNGMYKGLFVFNPKGTLFDSLISPRVGANGKTLFLNDNFKWILKGEIGLTTLTFEEKEK